MKPAFGASHIRTVLAIDETTITISSNSEDRRVLPINEVDIVYQTDELRTRGIKVGDSVEVQERGSFRREFYPTLYIPDWNNPKIVFTK